MKPWKLAAACSISAAAILVAVPGAGTATAATSPRASGSIAALGSYYFTIQRPGRATGVLAALTKAATRITGKDYPYVWGGGHGEAGVASVGERGGPGYNGKRKGFDCSGSVAAVLVAGGLWPQGSGVPSDAGMIQELRARHLIVRGAGTGPKEVTLYDDSGVHIFMNIDGRFFGTSDGGGGGDRKGGPGWLDDGAWDVSNRHFKRWHFRASVLRARTTAGLLLTFATGDNWTLLNGIETGDAVSVTYTTSKAGTMVAEAVTPTGEQTLSGTIASSSGSTLTVSLSGGQTRTLQLDTPSPVYGLAVGDTVSIIYTTNRSSGTTVYEARAVTITGTPAPPSGSGGGSDYGYSSQYGSTSIAPLPDNGGVGVNR